MDIKLSIIQIKGLWWWRMEK